MADKPQISIIIPVYNVEKYLACCLNSALSQTFADFEAICIDDGSTDNSLQILKEYAQRDARIKVTTRENRGLSVTRNEGIQAARGEYIYFLDSDDAMHPQLLEVAHHFAQKQNAPCVVFKYDKKMHKASGQIPDAASYKHKILRYDDVGAIPFKITDKPLFLFKKNLMYKMTYYVWARLYKRELLEGINFIADIQFEDDPFTIAVCGKHPKTVLLNEPLYFYTNNKQSISNLGKKEITPKQIDFYRRGTDYIYERYKNAPKEDFDFVAKTIIPRRLRIQYRQIKKAVKEHQPQLLKLFTQELADAQSKGFLPFTFNPRDLFYLLKYRKLLGKAAKL
ncbi:MAG: glycosyltransferase [Elusimicrobiota bacterium]|jgi:glycosyltransferase involved in cell wall biosynthesis|nr:glycosyltransferase [Elusimicrobiota bacterium]